MDVEIIVHRGGYQVGGGITEIRTRRSKVIVDLGQNFPYHGIPSAEEDKERVEKLFSCNSRKHSAVVFSHAHPDHVGLLPYLPMNVPVYMSKGTKALCAPLLGTRRISTWTSASPDTIGKTFWIGDIGITPIMVSHSIFDSSMLLIQAGGKRILYTGDFRLHGLVQHGLCTLLYKYILPIDVLLVEGTMLTQSKPEPYETDLVPKMAEFMSRYRRVFVLCSANDAERLSVIHTAASRVNRKLWITNEHLYERLRLYRRIYNGGDDFAFPVVYKNGEMPIAPADNLVFPIVTEQCEWIRNLRKEDACDDDALIFSCWPNNYLSELNRKLMPEFADIRSMFSNVTDIHTTGHVLTQHLCQVVNMLQPADAIVCMHSDDPKRMLSIDIDPVLRQKIVPFSQELPWIKVQ